VEQLEVLLFLRHHADRAWTASDIASELRATESAIELRLDDLTTRGLAQKASDGTFRYASSERYEGTVKELSDVTDPGGRA
jgi:predicted transcriptional regulator